jgi:hypothetical protein
VTAPFRLRRALRTGNPSSPPPSNSQHSLAMDAMDDVIASMSPDDTAATLRLLRVLEECRQMSPTEAEEWRRRIEGWAVAHPGGRRDSGRWIARRL